MLVRRDSKDNKLLRRKRKIPNRKARLNPRRTTGSRMGKTAVRTKTVREKRIKISRAVTKTRTGTDRGISPSLPPRKAKTAGAGIRTTGIKAVTSRKKTARIPTFISRTERCTSTLQINAQTAVISV